MSSAISRVSDLILCLKAISSWSIESLAKIKTFGSVTLDLCELKDRRLLAWSSDEFSALIDITSRDSLESIISVDGKASIHIDDTNNLNTYRYIICTKSTISIGIVSWDNTKVMDNKIIDLKALNADLTKYERIGGDENSLFFIGTVNGLTNCLIVDIKSESALMTNSMVLDKVVSTKMIAIENDMSSMFIITRDRYNAMKLTVCDTMTGEGMAAWSVSTPPIDIFPPVFSDDFVIVIEKIDREHWTISCHLPEYGANVSDQLAQPCSGTMVVKVFIDYVPDTFLVNDVGLCAVSSIKYIPNIMIDSPGYIQAPVASNATPYNQLFPKGN